ncbi:aldehyde dehydrogenase (NADP(+)), partial [Nocardia sp. NPDC004750]
AFTAGVRRLAATEAVWTAAKGSDAGAACTGVPQLFVTTGERFLADRELHEEVFGPASIIVRVTGAEQFATLVDELEGQLTATVHAVAADRELAATLLGKLELIAGRVLFDGWPTGVEVGHAVVHGGPFPATSAPSTTSVGSRAIERFLRPVAYQNVPDDLLADEIRADNPLGIWRRVDGVITRD